MRAALRRFCAVAIAGLAMHACSGCSQWHSAAKLALPPIQTSPESVALEIVFVQFPFGDREINGPLWTEIDEQELAPDVRQRLNANGFRAGVVSGQLPASLEKLLKLSEAAPTPMEQTTVDVTTKPKIHGLRKQTRLGDPFKIIAAGEIERLPTLTTLVRNERGEVQGSTYSKVQCHFETRAFAEPDGRIRFELLPQVEHGEPRQQFVQGQTGAYEYAHVPPHEAYEQLRLEAHLSPGQMLVLGGLPGRLGSLGYHYFTEEIAGRLEQKLLLIRLVGSGTADAAVSPAAASFGESSDL
ncbi:MAG TPA: hypothetical protein VHC19_24275 [Pirellulales bacterium]|nr:hypothetical protein [Pirellulales bacterium]